MELRCVICGWALEEQPNGVEVTNWAPGRPVLLIRYCEECWLQLKKIQERSEGS